MPNSPENYSLITYVWVMGLSILGGIARVIFDLKKKVITSITLLNLVGEIFLSGFIGMMSFYICEYMEVPQPLGPAIIGVSAFMGTTTISLFIIWVRKKFGVEIK